MSADAERFVQRIGKRCLVGRNYGAFDLVGEPGKVIIKARRVFHLPNHFAIQLAVIPDLGLGQPLSVFRHQLTQLAQFDPTPAALTAKEFPRVHAWVSKVEDLSGVEVAQPSPGPDPGRSYHRQRRAGEA